MVEEIVLFMISCSDEHRTANTVMMCIRSDVFLRLNRDIRNPLEYNEILSQSNSAGLVK